MSTGQNGNAGSSAASLRWRARIAKEALSVPMDDSVNGDGNGSGSIDDEPDGSRRGGRFFRNPTVRRILRAVLKYVPVRQLQFGALISMAAAIFVTSCWSLASSRSLHVAVSAALNVSLGVVAVWQYRVLHYDNPPAGQLKRDASQLRDRYRSLTLEKERLGRRCALLDTKRDRMRRIRSQLLRHAAQQQRRQRNSLISATDDDDDSRNAEVDELVTTLQQYQHVHSELRRHLQYTVQQTILRAALLPTTTTTDEDSTSDVNTTGSPSSDKENDRRGGGDDEDGLVGAEDHSEDAILSRAKLERLVRDLREQPGVSKFDEKRFREMMTIQRQQSKNKRNRNHNFSENANRKAQLRSVASVLRHVAGESSESFTTTKGRNKRPSSTTSSSSSLSGMWSRRGAVISKEDAVFQFDTRKMKESQTTNAHNRVDDSSRLKTSVDGDDSLTGRQHQKYPRMAMKQEALKPAPIATELKATLSEATTTATTTVASSADAYDLYSC